MLAADPNTLFPGSISLTHLIQSMSSIEQRVQAVIARTFNLAPGEAGGNFRMGNPPSWDSVGHMGLILDLEDEFGITFPTYEVATLQSVPDIVRAISAKTPG